MLYLANAFSIQMLSLGKEEMNVRFVPVQKHIVAQTLHEKEWKSVIGHQDTANVVSDNLGIDVEFNREFITLNDNDVMIVAQIEGGRLPEGCTELPSDYELNYYIVEVNNN